MLEFKVITTDTRGGRIKSVTARFRAGSSPTLREVLLKARAEGAEFDYGILTINNTVILRDMMESALKAPFHGEATIRFEKRERGDSETITSEPVDLDSLMKPRT